MRRDVLVVGEDDRGAAAQERGGDVGVDDDGGHARPARREASRSARKASYSSSDSKGSTSAARSSTEVIGLMPWRRPSSSVGTKSSAGHCSGCSGVLLMSSAWI